MHTLLVATCLDFIPLVPFCRLSKYFFCFNLFVSSLQPLSISSSLYQNYNKGNNNVKRWEKVLKTEIQNISNPTVARK